MYRWLTQTLHLVLHAAGCDGHRWNVKNSCELQRALMFRGLRVDCVLDEFIVERYGERLLEALAGIPEGAQVPC